MAEVSVPRRGFRSLLHEVAIALIGPEAGFSPPKGIQVFATLHVEYVTKLVGRGFSPPKGIQVFATRL